MRDLTRADLGPLPARAIRRGHTYKPDLLIYQVDGEEIVLKDYGSKRGPWLAVVGAICTGLEARALRVLAGLKGVPQFRGRPDRYSVAMTYIAGRRVRGADPELRGNERFVRELERIVARMHRRGVVHLDLKHRSNLMVSSDGWPVVLDFESALCFDPRWFGGRLAVRLLGRLDLLAVQNWKRRLCPHTLSESEMRAVRLARRLRGWWLPRRFLDLLLSLAHGARSSGTGDGGPPGR